MTVKHDLSDALLCIGNPLLDISVIVHSDDLLRKYNLKADNATLAEESHLPLYKELVESYSAQFVAGGAAQNAARGAQFMLPAKTVNYFGCVGVDEFGDKLYAAATEGGIQCNYLKDPQAPTGTCAVIVTDGGKARSLVANLGAANNYKPAHLQDSKNWALVEKARFFYVEGYFLTVSPPTIQLLAEHACALDKIFSLNLSAPFLCQFYQKPLKAAMPFVDILFGNETEAVALAEAYDFKTTDVKDIAKKASLLPKSSSTRTERIVVFTQGADSTIVAIEDKVTEYPILTIDPSAIRDTNGAGDGFVGGFFSQLVQGKPMKECLHAGHALARVVIQRDGATYGTSRPSLS